MGSTKRRFVVHSFITRSEGSRIGEFNSLIELETNRTGEFPGGLRQLAPALRQERA